MLFETGEITIGPWEGWSYSRNDYCFRIRALPHSDCVEQHVDALRLRTLQRHEMLEGVLSLQVVGFIVSSIPVFLLITIGAREAVGGTVPSNTLENGVIWRC